MRNADQNDPGMPFPVFAYSGARHGFDLAAAKRVALDITALITLQYLGLLRQTLARFATIKIAPGTLRTMFVERQHLKFHQPSQIERAERLQSYIALGRLKVMPTKAEAPFDLAREIGQERAGLLSNAQAETAIVVCNAPMTKAGSLQLEPAQLGAWQRLLTDTLAVRRFLMERGHLDQDAQSLSVRHLANGDEGWKEPAEIVDQAVLYLDDLAVNSLDHAGLLEPLMRAGLSLFVHPDLDRQTRSLIHHGRHRAAQIRSLERICSAVAAAVDDGKILFSQRHTKRRGKGGATVDEDDEDAESLETAPTLDLLTDLEDLDAVIVDDRCLNKASTWTDRRRRSAPCATVLDVLSLFDREGIISRSDHWRALYRLRAAAYYAVPVEASELLAQIKAAPVRQGRLQETPELRVIRESLLWPLVHKSFLAQERHWLDRVRQAICQAISLLWQGPPEPDIEARAGWLLAVLPNPLDWLAPADDALMHEACHHQLAAQTGLLLLVEIASRAQRERYTAWLSKSVVEPMRLHHPALWDRAITFVKSHIVMLADRSDA